MSEAKQDFEDRVYAARREKWPAMRRQGVVGIIHNGGTQRVYQCAQCGAEISMCAKWPMTRRVSQFLDDHESKCGRALLAEIETSREQ